MKTVVHDQRPPINSPPYLGVRSCRLGERGERPSLCHGDYRPLLGGLRGGGGKRFTRGLEDYTIVLLGPWRQVAQLGFLDRWGPLLCRSGTVGTGKPARVRCEGGLGVVVV